MPKCIDCGNRFRKKDLCDSGRCENCEAEYIEQEKLREKKEREEFWENFHKKEEERRLEKQRKDKQEREEFWERFNKRAEADRIKKEEEERQKKEKLKKDHEEWLRKKNEEEKRRKEEAARKAEELSKLKEKHKVVGIKYHEDAIRKIVLENPEYNYTKKELIDDGFIGERVYQYELAPSELTLRKEPDNPHDPNAIMVIIDDEHVGYIKSGSCAHVNKLIDDNRIESASAFFGGGKYKVIESDYDIEKDKDVYKLTTGETNIFIDLTLFLKPEEDGDTE